MKPNDAPQPLDLTAVEPPPPLLGEIPGIIGAEGRVRGFEKLRDVLLANAERLGPLLAVIKTILETDRHALFAAVAAEKQRHDEATEQWNWYKKYLSGEVMAPYKEDLGTEAAHARPHREDENE